MRTLVAILALALLIGTAGAFDVSPKMQPTQPLFPFGQAPIGVGDKIITPPALAPIFSLGAGPIPVGDQIITPLPYAQDTIFSLGAGPIPVGDQIITPPPEAAFGFGKSPLFGNTLSPQPDQSPIFGFGRR